jgi:ATP-binding cassette subfamily B protein
MTKSRGGGRLVASYAAGHKGLALAAAVALVIAAAGMLMLFSNAGWFTNQIFAAEDPGSVDRAFLIFALSLAAVAIASGARFALVSTFGERVANDIRRDLFERLLRYEYSFFETHRPGELATHMAANVTVLQQALGSTISVAARSAITLIGGVALLLLRSPLLFGAVMVVAPLAIAPLHFWGARVRKASQAAQEALGDATSRFTEAIIGIETVKLFGQEAEENRRFADAVGRMEAASLRQIRFRTLLNILLAILLFGAVAVIVWIGARQMAAGTISSAELASSVGLFVIVASSIAALGDMYGEYQKVSGAIDEIADLMDKPAVEHRSSPDRHWDGGKLGLSFNAVQFRYPSRPDHVAIADLSLRVAPGERIALVGPSGAGKSTLFKLLQGLYEPDSGEIVIGAAWHSRTSVQSPAAFLSVVPQDVMIFADTALANIRFARAGASLEEVRQAARTAHADEFISALPDGYETQLGPRGVRLSGGQRQRIAIARAALRDSPVLLLDEATSSLDSESERMVLDALARLMKDRTTLIIAHRFSTVADADRTVVMDAGGIVDEGRHEVLLRRCPLYERLVHLQLRH